MDDKNEGGSASGSSKVTFKPKVTQRARRVQAEQPVGPPPQERPQQQQHEGRGRGRGRGRGGDRGRGRGRGRGAELSATASGPFALGPSRAGSTINAPSRVDTTFIFDEGDAAALGKKEEVPRDKAAFDVEDPMAPVMVGAINEDGGMKRMAVRSDGLIDQTEPFISEQETSELLFFQLPHTFPILSVPPRSKDVLVDAPPGVQHPEGKVGRMVVYRSGRVKMELGNVPFDVTPAAEAEFYQTITTVNAETKHAYVLGQVKKRYVCSPDVDALLQQEMPEDAAEDAIVEPKDDLMDEDILEVTEAGPSGFHLSSDDDDVDMVITL